MVDVEKFCRGFRIQVGFNHKPEIYIDRPETHIDGAVRYKVERDIYATY